jgi:hypothetical protein
VIARTLWWEFLGGAGLFGLILGVFTINFEVVLGSVLLILACLWHWRED